MERNDCSWSLENVPTRDTRALMAELAAAHPNCVAYGVFNSADFGGPQNRLRLIAGPPRLIHMLQGILCTRRMSVREAFNRAGMEPPAGYCKNQTRSQRGGPTMRPVETQSFAVCAGHALTWCDARGNTVRVMTAQESATLMGFPSTWALPNGSRAAQQAVGNAMCVALSKAIILSAVAVQRGEASVSGEVVTTPAAPAPEPTKMPPANEVTYKQFRRLRRRVNDLEKMRVAQSRSALDD